MKRIDKLTTEQEARFPEWVDKWIKIGLSTEPADFETFDKYIRVGYEKTDIPFPNNIIRVSSPMVGAFAASISESILRGGAVDDAVGGAVGGAVRDAIHGAVGGAVYDAVDDAVGGAVGDAVGGAVGGAKEILWHYWLGGQFWVGGWWGAPAYVSFFTDVCGLELTQEVSERTIAYRKICESVSYVWPNRNFVIVCDRPAAINLDAEGRLHSETGKAIEYRDGWGLSAWHGTAIPSEWISDKNSITPEIALKWENIEQRRCACEILGWENILDQLNPESINKDDDPMIGELLEADLPGSGKERFLKVQCGTGRTFVLPVDPSCKTALEANLWTYGLEPDHNFIPEIRT